MEGLRDVTAKILASSLELSEFELQSYYYVHFQTNICEKCMNTLNNITDVPL